MLLSGVSLANASTLLVPAGGDLQAALITAKCGDTIAIEAGATFQTSNDQGFIFPQKTGGPCTGSSANTITVRTSTSDSASGWATNLSSDASKMARLVTTGPYPALSFAANSRFWKLIGLEITSVPNPQHIQFLVFIGTDLALNQVPSDITFDRCYIHSQEDGTNNAHGTVRGGVDVHAARVTFSGCRIAVPTSYAGISQSSDTNLRNFDRQRTGPLTIDNSFINAWFSCFFLGGSPLETEQHGHCFSWRDDESGHSVKRPESRASST